jgi:regulator of protease activity HflC (stomatin/prohibitin superfamily)
MERIVDPAVQEVVKAITARYTAVELITQREKVRNEIKDLLRQRLIAYDIIVDDFSIVNFRFSQQFEAAIESKQTAEQLALIPNVILKGSRSRLIRRLRAQRQPSP